MIIDDKKFIGNKIKEQRKKMKLTQFELAEKVGMHEKQLSRIEAGLHYPSLENFFKILNILDIPLSEFEKTREISTLESDIRSILEKSSFLEIKIYHDVIHSIRNNLCEI